MMTGEINQQNLYLLLPSKVSCLAGLIQKHNHVNLVDAIKSIYASNTYKRLEDEESKMWHLGPVALYQDFSSEVSALADY